ncbi:MAG: hypothetical protein IPG72_10560 [Ardenticatenales bacterium]|nr:hypothetical protein [Ardenticatenales bacterium]
MGSRRCGASRLAGIQGAGATGIQVQNLDATQSATVLADFYKQSTSAVTAIQVSRPNVPAGGAVNMYLPTVTELTNGAYAAIISADRQIAAIARTDWTTSGAAAIYSNVQPGKGSVRAVVGHQVLRPDVARVDPEHGHGPGGHGDR